MVAFSSVTINEFYNMSNMEMDEYRAFMQEHVDYVEILNMLCHPGARWKTNDDGELLNFKTTYLTNDAMSWFLLIKSRIVPSGHISDVTMDRAVLIQCIMTVKSVDIGKFFEALIFHASRGKTTLGLSHSSLITDLCQYAGVTWDYSVEALLKVRSMIERLTALENRVETHCQRIDAFMRYMTNFIVALAQHFPGGSSDYMTFPQPPTWPPHDSQGAIN